MSSWDDYEYDYDPYEYDYDPYERGSYSEPINQGDPERSFVYSPAKLDILTGNFNWEKSEVQALLVGSAYVPSKTHSSLVNDLPLDAVMSTAALDNRQIVVREILDDAGTLLNVEVWCVADDVRFPYDGGDFESGYIVLVYARTKLLVCIPFRQASVIDSGVVVVWDRDGIFSL